MIGHPGMLAEIRKKGRPLTNAINYLRCLWTRTYGEAYYEEPEFFAEIKTNNIDLRFFIVSNSLNGYN